MKKILILILLFVCLNFVFAENNTNISSTDDSEIPVSYLNESDVGIHGSDLSGPVVIPWYYTLDSHWEGVTYFAEDESRIHITYDEFKNGDFEFRKDDAGNFHLYPKKVNSLDDLGLNSSNLHLTYEEFKNGDFHVFLRDGEICLSSDNNYYSRVIIKHEPDNSSDSVPVDNNLTDIQQVNSSLNSSAIDNPDSQVISTLSKSTGIPIALLLVVLAIVGVGFIKKD